jgi:hypothetical protein
MWLDDSIRRKQMHATPVAGTPSGQGVVPRAKVLVLRRLTQLASGEPCRQKPTVESRFLERRSGGRRVCEQTIRVAWRASAARHTLARPARTTAPRDGFERPSPAQWAARLSVGGVVRSSEIGDAVVPLALGISASTSAHAADQNCIRCASLRARSTRVAANMLHLVPDLSGALTAFDPSLEARRRARRADVLPQRDTALATGVSAVEHHGIPRRTPVHIATLRQSVEAAGVRVTHAKTLPGVIPIGFIAGVR